MQNERYERRQGYTLSNPYSIPNTSHNITFARFKNLMQKKFVSSLLLLLLLNLLVKPLWIFGIDLTVQNRVGAAEYGLYAAIFSFTLIFNIILDLGLTHFNNRAIARDSVQVARNFSRLTGLKLLLGFVYLLVSFVAGFFLQYTSVAFGLLLVLSVNQFIASFILFLRSHLAGLHLFKSDSLMSVLDKLLMIITCGLLLFTELFTDDFTIMHFALAQMFSYVLAAVVGFMIVLRKARFFKLQFDFRNYGRNLRESLPYAILILLMALYTRVDSVMLEQISGAFENGIYFQAFRLLDVVNQLGYLFAVLLLPIFSGMFGRKENVENLSRLAFSLIYTGALAVVVASWFWADAIMNTLYVAHAGLSTPVFRILIISSLAFGSTYVFGTLLTARGNLRALNIVALSGFVLNIGLNFILIPKYGAEGAAIATVFTQFITAVVQLVLSFRLAQISFPSLYWMRLVLFTLCAVILGYALARLDINWMLSFAGSMVFTLLLSIPFKMINVRAAIDLVQTRFK